MTSPLFDKQATGGVVARNGFGYQDAYLLQHMPVFLAQGAFSHAVSEVLGDLEVRYYRPTGGTYCVLYEAKKNQLTKSELWAEVERFLEVFEKAPDEYVRFVLVCGDFVGEFSPLFNKLQRLRGPGASLNEDSAIRSSAETDIVATVEGFGQSNKIAKFVLERVSFAKYDDSQVDGSFAAAMASSLPDVADMRGSEVAAFRAACKALVDHATCGLVSRSALESALMKEAPTTAAAWRASATTVELGTSAAAQIEGLHLDVARFNGPDRGTLGPQWQQLCEQAQLLGKFVHESRDRRAVRLSAKQRMSLACLLGFSFSATRGFTLQLLHNGSVFDTSVHERASVPSFTKDETPGTDAAGQGVVAVTFPNAEWGRHRSGDREPGAWRRSAPSSSQLGDGRHDSRAQRSGPRGQDGALCLSKQSSPPAPALVRQGALSLCHGSRSPSEWSGRCAALRLARQPIPSNRSARIVDAGRWTSKRPRQTGKAMKTATFGMRPLDRLVHIPPRVRPHHEFCFFLHDRMVALLTEYEAAGVHRWVSEGFADAVAKNGVEGEQDVLEVLKKAGLTETSKHLLLSHLTLALTADLLHFLFEGLCCLEKRKFAVAFSLLRKPFKENMLFLAWLLGDPEDFLARFEKNTYTSLNGVQPARRQEILKLAIAKLATKDAFDAELIDRMVFSKEQSNGFEPLWQKATHLITSQGKNLKTEDLNINFIFNNASSDHLYYGTYDNLSYLMLFLVQLALRTFSEVAQGNIATTSHLILISLGTYECLTGSTQGLMTKKVLKPLRSMLTCLHCDKPFRLDRQNAMSIYLQERAHCKACGLESEVPLYWLLAKANVKITPDDYPSAFDKLMREMKAGPPAGSDGLSLV